jgi:hypothetical protein
MTQNQERASRKARQNGGNNHSITIKEEVMNRTMNVHVIALSALMGMFLLMSGVGQADTLSEGHRKVSGVVTVIKGDIVTVKTETGTLFLNQNEARAHGHAEWKKGDEATIIVNLNNDVIDAHPKGEEGHHHFYTGKLVYVGKMNKEIKLDTITGEKVFPLGRIDLKTKPIEEGEVVTVELNESGTVIDIRRGAHGEVKH